MRLGFLTILSVLQASQRLQTGLVERSKWLAGDGGHGCGCDALPELAGDDVRRCVFGNEVFVRAQESIGCKARIWISTAKDGNAVE